jgi:hypothetical protein
VACTYQNLVSILLARSLALTRPAERQVRVLAHGLLHGLEQSSRGPMAMRQAHALP